MLFSERSDEVSRHKKLHATPPQRTHNHHRSLIVGVACLQNSDIKMEILI